MRRTTTILLLLPPLFTVLTLLYDFNVSNPTFIIAITLIGLAALCAFACLVWGLWIFKVHKSFAWLCISCAVLYLGVMAFLFWPRLAASA
jgi:hypothetical protein